MRTLIGVLTLALVGPAYAAPVGPLSTFLVEPCRLVDTREAPLPFHPAGPVEHETSRRYVVRESCGVPLDAVAVVVNITGIATAPGHLVAWGPLSLPLDDLRPATSSLNFAPGSAVANQATILLGPVPGLPDLEVAAIVPGGSAHLILDVVGYLK